jgi:hypothetical protein
VYVVDNAGDDLAAVRHINACGGPADGRAVLRPTPGARDVDTLGWDLLVAVAKPPHGARREHVSGLSWEYGQSWLAGFAVSHMIIDRAHLLTRDQAGKAAAAAARAGATLWLLWGTATGLRGPGCGGPPHLVAGQPAQVISLWEFYQRLPAAPPPATEPDQEDDWPPLPAADFPTFLAACRRYLPRDQFAQVAPLYYDTAEAADAWLETYGAPRDPRDGQLTAAFEGALAGWLRDSAIGPAPCGPAALVRLRAVQAALFIRAIVLSWQPGPLGPDPASRLPGNLTPQLAGALATTVRTDAAAATALSAHLNHGPAFFGTLQIGDVAPDGSAIRVPASRGRPDRRGITPGADGPYDQMPEADERTWREMAAAEPIRIPACARALFTAHLAYRHASGATGTDPYFAHPRDPAGKPATQNLRGAIRATAQRIGLDLPWMHGDSCQYGADIGLTRRGHSWLSERGLRLARTGPGQDPILTPPRGKPCRPRWITGEPP